MKALKIVTTGHTMQKGTSQQITPIMKENGWGYSNLYHYIKEAVNYEELVHVYYFEDIPLEYSIYEQEEVFNEEQEYDGY